MPKFTPPPIPYSKWKQLLGRYDALYAQWQGQLDAMADLKKENVLLKQDTRKQRPAASP